MPCANVCLGLCTIVYLWETSPGRGASRGFRGARQRSQDLKTGRREPDSAEREEEGGLGNRASRRAGREGAGEAGPGRGGRGEVRTVGPGAPADHADNYGKREVERASGTDRPALARRRGCQSRRGRWFARPRRPARCAGRARKRTRVGLSGNSPGPLPATRGAPGCRQRSPFQRLSQRGADESLPKREGRCGQTPRAVAHLPPALCPSAPPRPPHCTPLVHLPESKMEAPGGGKAPCVRKANFCPAPRPTRPGSLARIVSRDRPRDNGAGNEVSFYSVSALLAKRTVAPNRISFLINKEERQRGCWVGEYQFPPRPLPLCRHASRSHRVCYRPAATAPVGCLSLMEAPGEGLAHLVHRRVLETQRAVRPIIGFNEYPWDA